MNRNELLKSIELLRKLVYGPTPVVYSGGSLQVLLDRLEKQVTEVPEGRDDVVVRHWERNLATFQASLFERAERMVLTPANKPPGTGMPVLLVSEDVTARAFDLCPPPPH